MNTASIAEKIAAEHKVGKVQPKQIVEDVLRAITDAVRPAKSRCRASASSRCSSVPRARLAIPGPVSRCRSQVAGSRKIAFQPAKALKDALNG